MFVDKLSDMVGGWFVGDFSPVVWNTKDFEVAVKYYEAGTVDAPHYHKVATEITVITQGRARIRTDNGVKPTDKEYSTGDIVIIMPGEITYFETLEPTITTVVKVPSVKNDKYII